MEEAERLCDRVALDRRRPRRRARHAGRHRLARRRGAAAALPPVGAVSTTGCSPALPEVRDGHGAGATVVVAGAGNLVQRSRASSRASSIVAGGCASSRPNLEDAFVALTGRNLDNRAMGELTVTASRSS